MELERQEIQSQLKEQSTSQTAYRILFRNVYTWMTLALIITALTAFVVASSETLLNLFFYSSKYTFYILIGGQFALVWYLSARINKMTFAAATCYFIAYSLLNGLTLSFIFILYTLTSISSTFFITAGMFGSMALIGTFTKKDLSSWGNILFMALIGLIIASVVNLFLNSPVFNWVITYIGVVIFVALTAYDANKIKRVLQEHGTEVNESTQKIALMGALSLYLDFINLFLFLLRILGSRR